MGARGNEEEGTQVTACEGDNTEIGGTAVQPIGALAGDQRLVVEMRGIEWIIYLQGDQMNVENTHEGEVSRGQGNVQESDKTQDEVRNKITQLGEAHVTKGKKTKMI